MKFNCPGALKSSMRKAEPNSIFLFLWQFEISFYKCLSSTRIFFMQQFCIYSVKRQLSKNEKITVLSRRRHEFVRKMRQMHRISKEKQRSGGHFPFRFPFQFIVVHVSGYLLHAIQLGSVWIKKKSSLSEALFISSSFATLLIDQLILLTVRFKYHTFQHCSMPTVRY